MQCSEGFPPVARSDARILILGSLPGQRSIDAQQYYAHPRNAFWPIMKALFGIEGHYRDRLEQLLEHGIALWDVLSGSVRPGSLDARIRLDSALPNDLDTFLQEHTDLRLIAFNGRKAEQLFNRFVADTAVNRTISKTVLPSTSPAYAAMPFSGKLAQWRRAIRAAGDDSTRGSRR